MSVTIQDIGVYTTLFAVTLATVRWFNRSAKKEIVAKLKLELNDEDDENSIGSKLTSIRSDLQSINRRVDHIEAKVNGSDHRLVISGPLE